MLMLKKIKCPFCGKLLCLWEGGKARLCILCKGCKRVIHVDSEGKFRIETKTHVMQG